MADDRAAPPALRTGTTRFTVDDREVRSLTDAALRAHRERIDVWDGRGMVRPIRLTFRPEPHRVVGVGTAFGAEAPLDTVRVVLAVRAGDPWRHDVVAVYPSFDGGTSDRFPALDGFVGAYFHRSWADTEMGPQDVMAHFLATATRDEALALGAELDELLASDDETVAATLVALDCNHDPADVGATDREWLTWMRQQLGVRSTELAPPASADLGRAGWQRSSRPVRGAGPRVAVVRFVLRAASFDGRASRAEFWWARSLWAAVCVLLVTTVAIVPTAARAPFTVALLVWLVVTLLPNLSLQCRRLHDTDRSGWLQVVQVVPVVGAVTLLVWNLLDSEPAGGRFDREAD